MSSPHHNERVDSVVESASGTAPARAVGEAARSALQSQRPTIGSGAVAPDTRARVKKGRRQGSGDYWSQRQKRSAARLSGMNVSASTAAAGGIVVRKQKAYNALCSLFRAGWQCSFTRRCARSHFAPTVQPSTQGMAASNLSHARTKQLNGNPTLFSALTVRLNCCMLNRLHHV